MNSNKVSLVTVDQELQAAMSIAKALGLTNGTAIDQACGAVLDFTGVDLKELFHLQDMSGVPVKPCYGPGDLAAIIGHGFNSREINKILTNLGLQEEIKRRAFPCSKSNERIAGYAPTEVGCEYAITSGKVGRLRVKNIKWRDSVIPLIKAAIEP